MRHWRTRAALVFVAVAIATIAALAFSSGRPSVVLLVYASALIGHAVVSAARPAPRGALVFAAAMLVMLVAAPPVFSDDLYRYVWDGRLLANGISPYAAPPSDPALAGFRDAFFGRINHPRIATVYPPLAEFGFALVSIFGMHGPKLLSALAAFGLVALVRREELASRAPAGATYTLATFPPLLVESALEGHVDTVAALGLVAALLALRGERPWRAAAFAAVSVMTKLVGVLLLPALVRRHRAAALVVVASLLLALVPLVRSGGSAETAGLAHYARRWSGGSPGFALVEHATATALVATAGVGAENVRLPFVAPVLERVHGTPFDPRVDLGGRHKEPSRIATLHLSEVAPFVTRILVAAGLSVLALVLARREGDALVSLRTLTFTALFFAPRMLPWYALHLAPLDALSGRRAGLVFGAVALLGHAPVDRWVAQRVYVEPTVAMAIGAALVIVLLVLEQRRIRD